MPMRALGRWECAMPRVWRSWRPGKSLPSKATIKARLPQLRGRAEFGVRMSMKNVARGIQACAPRLARSAANAGTVATAIMTSDTRCKEVAIEFRLGDARVRIGGICKGAGMIQPGMRQLHATMLAFIT